MKPENLRILTPDEINMAIASFISETTSPQESVSPDDVIIYIGHHLEGDNVKTYLSGAAVLVKDR